MGHREIAEFARVSRQSTAPAWSVPAHRELKMHTPVMSAADGPGFTDTRCVVRSRTLENRYRTNGVNPSDGFVSVQLLMKYRRALMSLLIHPAGLATVLFFVVMILRAWRLYRS